MPNIEKKQAVVNEIKDKLAKACSVVLVDARGLTVEQDTSLRKKLRDAKVDYKVYKNTLVDIAVKGTEFECLSQYLAGPNAFAFAYDETTNVAQIFSKEFKAMPALEFKAGYVEKTLYDAEGIKIIAEIPSRDELLSKLLGSFKSPMASFARCINAIAEKQGETA